MNTFCSLFGYTKQAYYKCSVRSRSQLVKEQQAKEAVLLIRRQMPRIGTRKLHFMLKEQFKEQQIIELDAQRAALRVRLSTLIAE